MSGPIKQIVSAISDQVITDLAAADYPALIDSKILLGAQYIFEQSAPPRIIFIPFDTDYSEKDVYNKNLQADLPYSTEAKAQILGDSIATEHLRFQIRCWGVGEDPDDDFDLTRALVHATILACRKVLGPFTEGGVEILKGKWSDAQTGASTQLIKYGRECVFGLSIGTPVLAELRRNPSSLVKAKHSNSLVSPTGESEACCSS